MRRNHVFCGSMLIALVIAGCSSLRDLPRYDDAIDIRTERQFRYETAPCACEESGSNRRDGRTLRGTVVEFRIRHRQDGERVIRDTVLVFLSRCAPAEEGCLEFIPLSDVVLPAQEPTMERNRYNNINRVRSFNTVTGIPEVRDVPIRIDSCSCDPLSLAVRLPSFQLRCPERQCNRLMVEARAIPPLFRYTDYTARTQEVTRSNWSYELAVGWRFGLNLSLRRQLGLPPCDEQQTAQELEIQTDYCYRWAIGLAFTYGPNAYNMFSPSGEDLNRPVIALHVRYNFDRILGCFRPFAYGQIGTAIDRITRRLWQLSISSDPEVDRATRELDSLANNCLPITGIAPSLPLSLTASAPPLTLGFGVGLEYPIARSMDIGVDIGYRSLGIGDELSYNGTTIPVGRRIGLWRLRVGVTF